jgi:hypothetical protein
MDEDGEIANTRVDGTNDISVSDFLINPMGEQVSKNPNVPEPIAPVAPVLPVLPVVPDTPVKLIPPDCSTAAENAILFDLAGRTVEILKGILL